MISFEPLRNYMKANGITQNDLASRIGITRQVIANVIKTQAGYLDTVIRICDALQWDIKDVIRYEEEDSEAPDVRHDINWDQFNHLMQQNNETCYSLAKKMNKGINYLTQAKKRNSRLAGRDINKICEYINCTKEDIIL